MRKLLEDLHAERISRMNRVIDEMAAACGLDLLDGLAPDVRNALVFNAECAYEEWFERIQDGELATPSTPVEFLLAEVYALDVEIREAMEGARKPDEPLQ